MSTGNSRYMHEHRTVVECINRGIRTITDISADSGIPEQNVYRSIAYLKRRELVEPNGLALEGKRATVYALRIPMPAVMASLPIELPPPTFDALETAFGVPRAVLCTLAHQARPRRVELMGMNAE